MRFYDPDSGSIMAGGHDVRAFSLSSWRRRLGPVFQESLLFNQSVLENIRMARPNARNEEVHDAARDAEIHTFIQSLPRGYDMPVGEGGGRLSGGQRQRVFHRTGDSSRPRGVRSRRGDLGNVNSTS
jgi:ABC-type multidrug transport system fused ATPase/permease subunit